MTHRLRLLVELDGAAVIDRDIVVASANIQQQNDALDVTNGPMLTYEVTGGHHVYIDYQDVLSQPVRQPLGQPEA